MIRAVTLIVFLAALSLPIVGSRARNTPVPKVTTNPQLDRLMIDANRQLAAGEYRAALTSFQSALTQTPEKDSYYRAAFLLGSAGAMVRLRDFNGALRSANEAARLARAHQYTRLMTGIAVARASAYRMVNARQAALEAMREVEPLVAGSDDPRALVQFANVLRDIDTVNSDSFYIASIEAARAQAKLADEAWGWTQLGYSQLLRGDFDAAERSLAAGYRIRRLTHDEFLPLSAFYLARLKRLQGDSRTAASLLRQVSSSSEGTGAVPTAFLAYERAMVLANSGRRAEALREFDRALEAAAQWRTGSVSGESFRFAYDVGLQQIYAAYLSAAMGEYSKSGSRSAAWLAFALAEENRATYFRQSLMAGARLPTRYWETLERYRRALAKSLSGDHKQAELVSRLRVELDDLEGEFGFTSTHNEKSHQINERRTSDRALSRLQRKLRREEAVISFHVSDEALYRWTVTTNTFDAQYLGSGRELTARAGEFRKAIESRSPAAREAGVWLYSRLFGELSPDVEARREWVLSLDGVLFDLPFAALVTCEGGPYLVERHTLRVTPGASMMTGRRTHGPWPPKFAAVADPIYNFADPRWKSDRREADAALVLARLPGTKREAARAAGAWGRDPHPSILSGAEVSRGRIQEVLRTGPGALHIAAHVVEHPSAPGQVLVGLGIQGAGRAEFLSPAEIATWKHSTPLVTLSGCGSGRGKTYPGLGLFGLTRAWLLSGAQAVVASYWPVADDDGHIVTAMYGHLAAGDSVASPGSVAEALRQAQTDALRSGRTEAHPAHWAAFFVMGRE